MSRKHAPINRPRADDRLADGHPRGSPPGIAPSAGTADLQPDSELPPSRQDEAGLEPVLVQFRRLTEASRLVASTLERLAARRGRGAPPAPGTENPSYPHDSGPARDAGAPMWVESAGRETIPGRGEVAPGVSFAGSNDHGGDIMGGYVGSQPGNGHGSGVPQGEPHYSEAVLGGTAPAMDQIASAQHQHRHRLEEELRLANEELRGIQSHPSQNPRLFGPPRAAGRSIDERAAELRERVAEAQRALDERAERYRAELAKEREELKSYREKLRRKAEQLAETSRIQRARMAQQREELERRASELQALRAENDESERLISQQREELNRRGTELQALRLELETAREARFLEVQSEVERIRREEFERLNSELDQTTATRIAEVEAQADARQQELNERESSLQKREEELERLRRELAKVDEEREEQFQLRKAVLEEQLEAGRAELGEEISSLRRQQELLAERDAALAERESALSAREAQLAELAAAHETRETHLRNWQQQLDAGNAELTARREELETALAQTRQQDQANTVQIGLLEARRDELDAQRAEFDRQQKSLDERKAELAVRAEELAGREAGLATDIEDLRRRRQELDEELRRTSETAKQAADFDRRAEELFNREKELEVRAVETTRMQAQLAGQADELERRTRGLAAESAAIEAQQEDLTKREKSLSEEKSHVDARILRAVELERRVRDRATESTKEEETLSAERESLLEQAESLDGRRQEFARDRAEIDRLHSELRKERELQQQREDELREERDAIDKARQEIEADRTEFQSARERLARQEAELSGLSRAHDSSKSTLGADLAKLEGEQLALLDRHRAAAQQRTDLDAARMELEEARLKLAKRVAETKEMSHKLAEKARRLANRKDQLIEEANALEARKSTLDSKAERIQAQRQEIEAQRSELVEERNRFEAEREQFETARQQLERAKQEFEHSLKQLHAERQEIQDGQSRVAQGESLIEAERLRLEEERQKIQTQRRELLEIQERHGVSSERLAALIAQAEQHEERLRSREQALASRELAVAGRAAELASADADLRARTEALDRKTAGIEHELANLERRRTELEALVTEHEDHIQRLREEAEAEIAAERESVKRREAECESLIASRRQSLETEIEKKKTAGYDEMQRNSELQLAERRAELDRHESQVQERLDARKRQVEADIQTRLRELESELAQRRATEEQELRDRRNALEARLSETRAGLDAQLEDMRRRQLALNQEELLLKRQRDDAESESPERSAEPRSEAQDSPHEMAPEAESVQAPSAEPLALALPAPRRRFARRLPLAACAVLCGALVSGAIMYSPNGTPSVRGRLSLGEALQAPLSQHLAGFLATPGLFTHASESVQEDLNQRFLDGTIQFAPIAMDELSPGVGEEVADELSTGQPSFLVIAQNAEIAPATLQTWIDAIGSAYVRIRQEARVAAMSSDSSREREREEARSLLTQKRRTLADVEAEIAEVEGAIRDLTPVDPTDPSNPPANPSLDELKTQLAQATTEGQSAAEALDRHRQAPPSSELPIPTPLEIAQALADSKDAIETLHEIDAKSREFHEVLTAAVAETQTPLIDLLSETDAFIEQAESMLLPPDESIRPPKADSAQVGPNAQRTKAISSIELPAELHRELEQVRRLLLDLQESAHAFATDWDQLAPKLASWTPAELTIRQAADSPTLQPTTADPLPRGQEADEPTTPNYLAILTQGELLLEYHAAAEKLIYRFYEASKSKLAQAIQSADQIARHGEPLPTRRIIRDQLAKAGHNAHAARNDWILAAQDLIPANNLQLKSLGDDLENLLERFDPRDAGRAERPGPRHDEASMAFLPAAKREAAARHAAKQQQQYDQALAQLQAEHDDAEQRRDELNRLLIKALDREHERQSRRAHQNESLRERQAVLSSLERTAADLTAEIAGLADGLGEDGADGSGAEADPSAPRYEALPPLKPPMLDLDRLPAALPIGAAVAGAFGFAASFLAPARRKQADAPSAAPTNR